MNLNYIVEKKVKYLEDKGFEIINVILINPETRETAVMDNFGRVYWKNEEDNESR